MRLGRALLFASFAATSAAASPALAQGAAPSVDLRGFRPSTDPASGLYLEPAASPATGEFNVGAWMSYAYRPVTLRDPTTGERAFDVLKHQLSSDLTLGVGLGKRVHLGLDLPILLYQTGDAPTPQSKQVLGDFTLPKHALGDIGLTGKLTLVQPTGGEFGGFALALHERLTAPTGDDGSLMSEGGVTSETRLLAEYRLVVLGIHAAAGFKARADRQRFACEATPLAADGTDACPTRYGNEIPWGFGLSLRPQAFGIDPKGRWTWYVETHGHLPAGPVSAFTSAKLSDANLGVGARFQVRDVAVLGGVEAGLVGGVGTAPVRGILSLGWAPRVHDIDGDGIEDDVDKCKELPEDKDGFQDDDGCPDADNDDDGVPDVDDKCPNVAEDEDGFEDDDGCPDPDNDKDGILDKDDACPNEAGPPSADPKKNGCPLHDRDNDGVDDRVDKCPELPEDRDGFQDEDGCPDPDDDGDGIPDADDACPRVPGVPAENPKENGCPDPDSDRDTFQGTRDKCPNDAETWNGIEDDDGCPDGDDKHKGKPRVTVTQKKDGPALEVAEAVKFVGPSEIDPASEPVLRALGAELLAHPGWTVAVSVRPAKKGGPAEAMAKAFAIVDALRLYTRRAGVAETVGWAAVKSQPRAEQHGVGFLLLAPVPDEGIAPGADAKPAAPSPKKAAPAAPKKPAPAAPKKK
jgi:hypothetical protein